MSSFLYLVPIFSFCKGENESVMRYIRDFYVNITYEPYPLENPLEEDIWKTREEIRRPTIVVENNYCSLLTLGVNETNGM